jgi:hypothetical protein
MLDGDQLTFLRLETLAGLLLAFFWRMKMLAEFPLAFFEA